MQRCSSQPPSLSPPNLFYFSSTLTSFSFKKSGNFENLALFERMSLRKFSKFYSLKDLLSFPKSFLLSKSTATTG